MLRRIANLKYLIASFLFVTLFFIQSLTLTWTPGYAFQALILNIAIMLGIYAFRGFDNLTTYSLNSCIVSYISGTVLGVLFALIPIVFFTPRLPRLTFFVTAAVSGLIFPFLSCVLMRYTIKHLPPRRYLVIGREEELGPILEEVKKASMGKIEIYSYMNPSAATLTEAISFEDVKPFDAILIGDPELARGVQPILNEAITKNTSIEYLPTLVESSLHRIPIEIIERFREYYEIVFSQARISRRIRVADIVFSTSLLVLFSPFILFSVLYILIRDGRPIFFTQPRHGINARIFKVYKFRTMNEPEEEEDFPTLTKSGKLLRMTRLNEIPQLFSVIKGDMSIVGPRPDIARTYEYCTKEIPFYRYRTRVMPGITGHAQVVYRYVDELEYDTFAKRLSYDLYYVKNMDFRLYLATMLRTAEVMLFRRGAK
ncbi:exopolysaccharide biosynthesis polyprenyl glycosylphosphotransferase [Mesotoga sp. HF07.pep.5.2.highcov]|uniref:sugar transferase n=1 Tax=Mesotoga sp. HF07.pep.5.2.highcov TaxID=1462923 RepID=UPI000EF15C73|nr:sugar transferase [Mesotoga sp. HF07.pep.5.2.highcov]RLL91178.1 exopolysaccharide biosynthesis polyprenyl glycosylphosphotransferase [Mesotoga sp. HF07.pep.5.2.highcov]